ncbi:MAG: S41 family peptidase [Pseudomonadota bacterium]
MGRYKKKNRLLRLIFLIFAFASLVIGSLAIVKNKDLPKQPPRGFGLNDKDVLLYLEAISRIQKEASFLDGGVSRKEIIQSTLKSYLSQQDAFSGYLTPKEYALFKESLDESYVGIGLEIERNENGDIVCNPYPKSAAEKAGVFKGDRLIKIDGIPVEGKSLFTIAALARGKKGTTIKLSLITKNGIEKGVKITRSKQGVDNVSIHRSGPISVIKIRFVIRNTNAELKHIVSNWDSNKPVVIDLRGNSGGDLHAAIDSAMLFLRGGKKIVSIESRADSKVYVSNNKDPVMANPIILWQDESTASAAEVFIAALTENGRAISIGRKSHGKGSRQEIIELSDGSAMVLTTGSLLTPNNRRLDGYGLNPTYVLKTDPLITAHYLAKVKDLVGL